MKPSSITHRRNGSARCIMKSRMVWALATPTSKSTPGRSNGCARLSLWLQIPRQAGLRSGTRCFKMASPKQPSELNVSLQLEPRMKQAYFLLGRAYSKVGRLDEAKAALKKLDELNRAEIPGQEKVPPATPIQNRARPK